MSVCRLDRRASRRAIYVQVPDSLSCEALTQAMSLVMASQAISAANKAAIKEASSSFGRQAASYAKYRPDYPAKLYQTIFTHCKLENRALAVDVATGSGQAAKDLSAYFKAVVALDQDPEQLKHAQQIHNVKFQLGTAEQTGLSSDCADLVAVAAGLHWYDLYFDAN